MLIPEAEIESSEIAVRMSARDQNVPMWLKEYVARRVDKCHLAVKC